MTDIKRKPTGAGTVSVPVDEDPEMRAGGRSSGAETGGVPHPPVPSTFTVERASSESDDWEVVERPPEEKDLFAALEVQARVVYLGQNRHYQVYMEGALEELADDDGEMHYRPVAVRDMAQVYNFSRFDVRGRVIKERLTPDGHIWSLVRHVGHLARFSEMLDADQAPLFRIEAKPAARRTLEEYFRRLKALRQNPDWGRPVLVAMGLA